jgi:hypothetical protein
MKAVFIRIFISIAIVILFVAFTEEKQINSASVPFILDHNRMLIEMEFKQKDDNWLKARVWVDTGNPDLFMTPEFARKLGYDVSKLKMKIIDGQVEVNPPAGVRIGDMPLNFESVKSYIIFEPTWLFTTMHNDINLPSTVLMKYQVVFDYPKYLFTIAKPGSLKHLGERSTISIHNKTGIPQLDAVIDGEFYSFALDNGASYSFTSSDILDKFAKHHPDWQRITGAVGCANIWGWGPPDESTWQVMRIPEFKWGTLVLKNIAIAGIPKIPGYDKDIGELYSTKTARPVAGFFGPNILKAYRVEIDYANSAIYFQKGVEFDNNDMDIIGLTLRQLPNESYEIVGVASNDGKPVVDDIESGDILVQIDGLLTTGKTMGTVIDSLRGKPGDIHTIVVERKGTKFAIKAKVKRLI